MLTYQQWDTIADTYTPILLLCAVIKIITDVKQKQHSWPAVGLSIMCCYILMFVDKYSGMWHSAGLDFSTHTAVAYALAFYLLNSKPLLSAANSALILSLVAYFALMLYQGYHSLADILSTLVVIIPLLALIYRLLKKQTDTSAETSINTTK